MFGLRKDGKPVRKNTGKGAKAQIWQFGKDAVVTGFVNGDQRDADELVTWELVGDNTYIPHRRPGCEDVEVTFMGDVCGD